MSEPAAHTVATPSAIKPSFLDRARSLMQKGALAAAPLAVVAAGVATAPEAKAQMSVDYSAVTSYSSSGLFTGVFLDEAAASGSINGNVATLAGERQVNDGLFWRWDEYQEKTVPRGGTTGLGFFWGGALIDRPRIAGDSLTVSLNFSVDFTHTVANQNDKPSISYELMVGYSSSPYAIDLSYVQSPRSFSSHSSNAYGSAYEGDATPHIEFSNELTLDVPEWAGDANYWFVQLAVNWDHEYVRPSGWNDNYSKLNGDTFLVTIPEGALTMTFTPGTAAIPEPAHYALGFGGIAMIAMIARRRFGRTA